MAEKNVLGHGQFGEQQKFLIDRRDAGAAGIVRSGKSGLRAVDQDRALGRLDDARHDLDERRFARAVLAKQRVNLAGAHVERDAVQRAHAGKDFFDVAHFKRRGASLMPAPPLGLDDERFDASVLQHLQPLFGRAGVGDERVHARQRANYQAAVGLEF